MGEWLPPDPRCRRRPRQDAGEGARGQLQRADAPELREEFAAEWLETRRPKLKPSTVASYADLLRDHINPRIGRVPLQKLTAEHLDALYTELLTKGRRNGTGGLSPRTV
ncbi:MAG: N-terminal phage integrase SAM-like domain-containing protein, partial [Actinomycetota bacterium]